MDGGSQLSQPITGLGPYQALVEVAESIGAHRDLSSLLKDLKKRLHLVVKFDAVQIVLHDSKHNLMRRHTLQSPASRVDHAITEVPVEEAPAGWVWQTQQPLLITDLSAYESRYPRVLLNSEHTASRPSMCFLRADLARAPSTDPVSVVATTGRLQRPVRTRSALHRPCVGGGNDW